MKYIDLTMPLNEQTPVYPGLPVPVFKQISSIAQEGWNEHWVEAISHFGTHMDAPWHFLENGRTISEFGVERFFGPGKVLDARGRRDIDLPLDGIQAGDMVLIRTDHSLKMYSPGYLQDMPGITPAFARKLAEKEVGLVGIDSSTIDNHPYEGHKILLRADILIVENLINLDQLPVSGFTLTILPLRYDHLDGAPCRAVAAIPQTKDSDH